MAKQARNPDAVFLNQSKDGLYYQGTYLGRLVKLTRGGIDETSRVTLKFDDSDVMYTSGKMKSNDFGECYFLPISDRFHLVTFSEKGKYGPYARICPKGLIPPKDDITPPFDSALSDTVAAAAPGKSDKFARKSN